MRLHEDCRRRRMHLDAERKSSPAGPGQWPPSRWPMPKPISAICGARQRTPQPDRRAPDGNRHLTGHHVVEKTVLGVGHHPGAAGCGSTGTWAGRGVLFFVAFMAVGNENGAPKHAGLRLVSDLRISCRSCRLTGGRRDQLGLSLIILVWRASSSACSPVGKASRPALDALLHRASHLHRVAGRAMAVSSAPVAAHAPWRMMGGVRRCRRRHPPAPAHLHRVAHQLRSRGCQDANAGTPISRVAASPRRSRCPPASWPDGIVGADSSPRSPPSPAPAAALRFRAC